MNGTIYKAVASITKEEILQACEFEDRMDMWGDIMSYDEFTACVRSYGITDYDGFGEIMLFDKVVSNSSVICDTKSVFIEDKFFIPFEYLYSIFGDDIKFIWHNK